MSKTVDFIFDFASPNAYLVHKIVPEIETRTGARFNYIPCLLGGIFKATGNQAPMIAFGGIKNKPEYDALEMQRFITRHELTGFNMNPHFPVISLMLVRGALVAERDGDIIHLGPKEFRLLSVLMERPERVFSREQLLDKVWGHGIYVEDRTVDVHMSLSLIHI